MNKITFPLKLNIQDPTVADLQDALQLCLDRSAVLANDGGARQQLSAALKPERGAQKYCDPTAKLVSIFQAERHLPPSGDVDGPTANAGPWREWQGCRGDRARVRGPLKRSLASTLRGPNE
jgi:hypothetical protein